MTTRERILDVLSEINCDIDFEKETKIIDDKVLDSFEIVAFISDLSVEFDIVISPKWLVPANFNSIDAIEKMICAIEDE